MSRKQLALVVVALVSVVVLSACGSSGTSENAPAPAEPSPPATTEPVAPAPAQPSAPVTTAPVAPAPPETMTTEETPGPEAVEIRVKDGQPVGGTQTVKVKQGDEVLIRVEVDAPQELHLHGYEIEQEAEPGTPAVFQFTATLEGIFDLESHLTDAKLVKLIVNP